MTGLRLTPPIAPGYSFEPEPWMASAVCVSTDPEAFFPMEGSSPRAAKKVCRGCPVKTGDHDKCAHRAGGPHEAGQLVHDADGELHRWRCGCDCHGYAHEPPPAKALGQLELFAVAS